MHASHRKVTNTALLRRKLIRRSLFLHDTSQASLARRLGISRGMVCHVIAGRKRHAGAERALARIVGMKRSQLWED